MHFALKGLLSLPFAALALTAHAVPIVGSSSGGFSSLDSCDSGTSGGRTCRLTQLDDGAYKQVQWGTTSETRDFVNPSTLTSVDLDIISSTPGIGVRIGQLDWFNSATIASGDLNELMVDWKLTLAFIAPSVASGTETFDLTIDNPLNPAGDWVHGLMLADLNSLNSKINLNGVSITNLRYIVSDGAGSGTSYFNNNVWYNDENNWSSLYILADFKATSSPTTKAPEPGVLGLLGLGLFVAGGLARRRRDQKTN